MESDRERSSPSPLTEGVRPHQCAGRCRGPRAQSYQRPAGLEVEQGRTVYVYYSLGSREEQGRERARASERESAYISRVRVVLSRKLLPSHLSTDNRLHSSLYPSLTRRPTRVSRLDAQRTTEMAHTVRCAGMNGRLSSQAARPKVGSWWREAKSAMDGRHCRHT